MIRIHKHVNLLLFSSQNTMEELSCLSAFDKKQYPQISTRKEAYLLRPTDTKEMIQQLSKLGYKPRVEKSS